MSVPALWKPSAKVFIRRALMMGIATFIATFAVVMLWEAGRAQLLTLGLGLPTAFTLFFFLEDAQRWRAVRDEIWELEPPHLNHDSADGRALVPLAQILRVHTRFGSVILTLDTGQRIAMRYLEQPAKVAAALDAARPA